MRSLRIRVFAAVVCIMFGVSICAYQALARPIEPITYDYAMFLNDPYPTGTLQMTIYVHREAEGSLIVYLLDPNWNQYRSWQFPDSPTEYQFNTYVSDIHGTWRLECYLPGYQPYITDATYRFEFSEH